MDNGEYPNLLGSQYGDRDGYFATGITRAR